MWKLSHNMHKIHWNHWKWSFYGLLTVQSTKKKIVSAFKKLSPFSMLCYRIRSQSSDPVQGWCHDLAALLVERVWNKRFVQSGTSCTYWTRWGRLMNWVDLSEEVDGKVGGQGQDWGWETLYIGMISYCEVLSCPENATSVLSNQGCVGRKEAERRSLGKIDSQSLEDAY